jgi:hypothetical protein
LEGQFIGFYRQDCISEKLSTLPTVVVVTTVLMTLVEVSSNFSQRSRALRSTV